MKFALKCALAVVVVTLLFIGYANLTQKPLPPDNSAKSVGAPTPPDSAKSADAQKPDVPEAYDITLRCEDTTGINMVSVDTVKGTAKSGRAFYKDGDTRVAPENDVFPSGCMVRDVVRVTDSTILIGTEAVVGTCDAVKDSGTGRFAAIDRLSGVMVVSLSMMMRKRASAWSAHKSPCAGSSRQLTDFERQHQISSLFLEQ